MTLRVGLAAIALVGLVGCASQPAIEAPRLVTAPQASVPSQPALASSSPVTGVEANSARFSAVPPPGARDSARLSNVSTQGGGATSGSVLQGALSNAPTGALPTVIDRNRPPIREVRRPAIDPSLTPGTPVPQGASMRDDFRPRQLPERQRIEF